MTYWSIHRHDGPTTDRFAGLPDEATDVYREVFTAPPWNEPTDAVTDFRCRLAVDVHRPGFTLVLARPDPDTASPGATAARPRTGRVRPVVAGFGTAFTTVAPWRTDRAYAEVAAHLGAERVRELLVDGLEVDELAVRPEARGAGLGKRLLAELTADAPHGRAWLLTAPAATGTVDFYRRSGWHEVPGVPASNKSITVFLSPTHPGA